MADPVTIPTPVANGSMEDAAKFVNSLPGSMSPEQRTAMTADNQGWHPPKSEDNTPDFIPEHATAAPNAAQSADAEAPDFIPAEGPADPAPRSFEDPRVAQLGYYVNGDGNTVIAPKEGESYEDTVRRAITHSVQMSPEERHAALARETKDWGQKVIGTAGGAAGVGLGGAALLALTAETPAALGEIATKAPEAYQAARAFVYRQLAAGTPTLFGEEAAKATLKRIAVKAATKLATGGAIGLGASLFHTVFEEMFGGK